MGATVESRAVVSAYCHIDDGSTIGRAAWIGSRCRIGHDTIVGPSAQLYYSCQVYDRVIIGESAVVAGFVCNDAVIGARAQVFGSLVHRLVEAPTSAANPHPSESEPSPTIEEEAIVGIGAVVIGGIVVGRGAYVAAGTVLTRDAEPNMLYMGNPGMASGAAPRPFE